MKIRHILALAAVRFAAGLALTIAISGYWERK